jgi:hypothetical protein
VKLVYLITQTCRRGSRAYLLFSAGILIAKKSQFPFLAAPLGASLQISPGPGFRHRRDVNSVTDPGTGVRDRLE